MILSFNEKWMSNGPHLFSLRTDQRMFLIVILSFLIRYTHTHIQHMLRKKGVRQVKYYLVIDYSSKTTCVHPWTWIACIIASNVHVLRVWYRFEFIPFVHANTTHNIYSEQWTTIFTIIFHASHAWPLDRIKGVNSELSFRISSNGKCCFVACYYLHIAEPSINIVYALKLINACAYVIFG